jgi:hypothetical protein
VIFASLENVHTDFFGRQLDDIRRRIESNCSAVSEKLIVAFRLNVVIKRSGFSLGEGQDRKD